eukprot:scaffold4277_cov405-Prasinococcus_capsulatus_cf.AAC.9
MTGVRRCGQCLRPHDLLPAGESAMPPILLFVALGMASSQPSFHLVLLVPDRLLPGADQSVCCDSPPARD